MAREQVAKVPSGRVKRTPITVRNRLSIKEQDPNYVYRVVNVTDAEGNVTNNYEARLAQGYEIDPSNQKVGDSRVDNPSSLGSANEISVGKGARAVIMRIPREYYEEDQAAKQQAVDELEATMKSNAVKGT
jgi:hypothetical protein